VWMINVLRRGGRWWRRNNYFVGLVYIIDN